MLLSAMPRATLFPVDSAGHLPHLERPGLVAGEVVRFLRAQQQRERAANHAEP
jgi:pimeloyl-ACP methyl ester carboxylesterase